MKTGYAVKNERGYFFKEFSVFGMEFTDKYNVKHANDIMVLDSLVEAKELAKTLSNSKFLNAVECLESEYYVVYIEITEETVEHEYSSKLMKWLGRPSKTTCCPAKIIEHYTIWSTND